MGYKTEMTIKVEMISQEKKLHNDCLLYLQKNFAKSLEKTAVGKEILKRNHILLQHLNELKIKTAISKRKEYKISFFDHG